MESQKILPVPSGTCGKQTEVYTRIVGYFRPVKNWNIGKKEEFKDRKEYDEEKSAKSEFGNRQNVNVIKCHQSPRNCSEEKG